MLAGILLCMHPASERRRYTVTLSLIGWVLTQNDPCVWELMGAWWLTRCWKWDEWNVRILNKIQILRSTIIAWINYLIREMENIFLLAWEICKANAIIRCIFYSLFVKWFLKSLWILSLRMSMEICNFKSVKKSVLKCLLHPSFAWGMATMYLLSQAWREWPQLSH